MSEKPTPDNQTILLIDAFLQGTISDQQQAELERLSSANFISTICRSITDSPPGLTKRQSLPPGFLNQRLKRNRPSGNLPVFC